MIVTYADERDKAFIRAVMHDDWDAVIQLCKKYHSPMPDDPKIMKAGVYKAVQYCTSIPEEVKDKAMVKCLELGFNPLMKPEGYDDGTD